MNTKLAQLKESIGSRSVSQLLDIFDEKTGESRAKVTPLIIASFEGDYQTIKYLIEVGFSLSLSLFEELLLLLLLLVEEWG